MRIERKQSGTEERYIVVDEATGDVLDNANGFGYRTEEGARKAYQYKQWREWGREKKEQRAQEKKKQALSERMDEFARNRPDILDTIAVMRFDNFKTCEYNCESDIVRKVFKDNHLKISKMGFKIKDVLAYHNFDIDFEFLRDDEGNTPYELKLFAKAERMFR